MKNWKDKIEKIFMATAFAEAGEHDIALEMVGTNPILKKKVAAVFKSIENFFAAVTYAEANCHELAREYIKTVSFQKKTDSLDSFLETVGLRGVRVCWVAAQI